MENESIILKTLIDDGALVTSDMNNVFCKGKDEWRQNISLTNMMNKRLFKIGHSVDDKKNPHQILWVRKRSIPMSQMILLLNTPSRFFAPCKAEPEVVGEKEFIIITTNEGDVGRFIGSGGEYTKGISSGVLCEQSEKPMVDVISYDAEKSLKLQDKLFSKLTEMRKDDDNPIDPYAEADNTIPVVFMSLYTAGSLDRKSRLFIFPNETDEMLKILHNNHELMHRNAALTDNYFQV